MPIRTLMLLTAAGLLLGCVSLRDNTIGGIRTFDALSEHYPVDASALAHRASVELASRYPVARTSLSLSAVPGVFGLTLENELRGQGFAVLTSETGSGVRIGYAIDAIQDEAVPTGYLEIRTSDGTRFSLLRPLHGGTLPEQPDSMAPSSGVAKSKPAFTAAPLKESAIPANTSPLTASAPAPVTSASPLPPATSPVPVIPVTPKTPVTTPKGNQNALLPKAILTVLPYNWRYQIPDADKRSMRVGWPKNVPWREAIRSMASEANCEARFDESARRVTLVAAAPRISTTASSGVTPSAKPAVSALHPALLPETVKAAPVTPVAPVAASTTTSPATPAKPAFTPAPGQVSLPSTKPVATPPIIEAALKSSPTSGTPETKASALTPAVPVKPIAATTPGTVLPVTPMKASSGSTPPPAKLIESDGSDSMLLKQSQPEETWSIEPGSLYSQLGRWTSRAGYQLVWNAQDDLSLEVQASFQGTFVNAIRDLFGGLQKTGHPLVARIYEDNKVMEVKGE